MAATNINRVVLTGNLTRDPELRSLPERHLGLQAARRLQHPPQEQRDRRVGGQAQLLRRHGLGRAGRELRPLPRQGPPGRDRRPPRVARVGDAGGQQAPGDRHHRRRRAVPRRPRRRPAAVAAASPRAPTSRSTTSDFQPAGAAAAQRRAPRRRTTTSRSRRRDRRGRPPSGAALCARGAGRRCAATSYTVDLPRPRARAPRACTRGQSSRARSFQQWRSSAAGRRAGVTRRAAPAPAAASPAGTAATRSTRSTTRTSRRCRSTSPTAARSARAASRAPAAGTRTRSPRPSSARASSRCCPYVGDNREDRDERGRPRRDDRDRDRER